ncbi:hypothetical protein M3O75_01470 [Klebsiella pneumoniae]|nr:hypothetical protein [Klebsiella pneumoniae]
MKASLPTTPMAMRGMYFYGRCGNLTDCATGKRVAVANNAQLERDYAAARGTDTRPVLLVVEGHFTRSEPGYRRDDENADDGSSRQIYSR